MGAGGFQGLGLGLWVLGTLGPSFLILYRDFTASDEVFNIELGGSR